MLINSECQLIRRPHLRLVGDALFFMASNRPLKQFSALEVEIWQALENSPIAADLIKQYSEAATSIIEAFVHDELCECVELNHVKGRRRIIVVEPHADDAALSIGGTLWKRRADCHFIVATVASRTNFTSYYKLGRDYFNIDEVMAIRREESKLFTAMIGGDYVELGMTDAVLRYDDSNWTLDFFKRHGTSISVATSRDPVASERSRWIDTLCNFFEETPSEEIWIPLGSPHADHELTMNTCIDAIMLKPENIKGRIVRFYQDVPYAARFPDFTPNMLLALERAGIQLALEERPIEDVFNQKLRLISLYASQFKLNALQQDIERSAAGSDPAQGAVERFWSIQRLPPTPIMNSITPASTGLANQLGDAVDWVKRNRRAQKMRILLLVPTGQWKSDLELLCEFFPSANFELYVGPEARAEIVNCPSVRVSVNFVNKGVKSWLALGVKLAFLQGSPTLFNAGGRHFEAGWISKCWLTSDSLVLHSMNELGRALAVVGRPTEVAE